MVEKAQPKLQRLFITYDELKSAFGKRELGTPAPSSPALDLLFKARDALSVGEYKADASGKLTATGRTLTGEAALKHVAANFRPGQAFRSLAVDPTKVKAGQALVYEEAMKLSAQRQTMRAEQARETRLGITPTMPLHSAFPRWPVDLAQMLRASVDPIPADKPGYAKLYVTSLDLQHTLKPAGIPVSETAKFLAEATNRGLFTNDTFAVPAPQASRGQDKPAISDVGVYLHKIMTDPGFRRENPQAMAFGPTLRGSYHPLRVDVTQIPKDMQGLLNGALENAKQRVASSIASRKTSAQARSAER